ncbi:MAG: carbohydrate binding family 9 domain-containing protein [Planctomycetes bacterium]|nr:carbohydrate binding family 9 domain-containing protein [Planctomycetota bacterium]
MILACVLALGPGSIAVGARAAPPQDPVRERRVARAVRTETAPVIDGVLDDAVWALAEPIGELHQVEPIEGAPTERTEVRVLFDAEHLYLGVRCFDSDPVRIVGTQMARDADLDPDDRVEIVIDTFLDRRNAYFFQMSPVGSKGDALIANNGQDFNKPWDGIWEGKSAIDALGWSFEMALPFQTLAFAPGASAWGLNVNRHVKRKNEVDRWNNGSRDYFVFQIAEAGDLTGLSGMRQGLGLDLVPFFHADWTNVNPGDADLAGKPGFDAFYRLTPSLQAILTVNTDFAETEVDARRLNLTRFPLFFPEKRDFFLQDAGIFGFGDLGRGDALLPFFSRRIGLDANGEEVPILYGGKLTGRHAGWNVGALDVHTEQQDGVPEKDLFVTRLSRNIGEQSTLGGIVTSGNPSGTRDNAVFGVDWNYRAENPFGDGTLTSSVWALHSATAGISGDDDAFGASLAVRSDLWRWGVKAREVQSDFDALLGFVPRRGIRSFSGDVQYRPRAVVPAASAAPSQASVRQWRFGLESVLVTDMDGDVETASIELQPFGFELESGDELNLQLVQEHEDLAAPFDIHDGVTIPAGTYDWLRARVEVESALKRPVSATLRLEGGEFYDGTREDLECEVSWRPSRWFHGSVGYEQNHVDLRQGAFATEIGRVRADVSFSPDLDWFNFVQFDNESDSLGWNSRLRWIPVPGQELFVVWNQTVEREGDALVSSFQEAAFKFGCTFRF